MTGIKFVNEELSPKVFLVNSGSEANDLAWRIAKVATNKSRAVVLSNAYHGNTLACLKLSPNKHKRKVGDYTRSTVAPSDVTVVRAPDL